ncbi:hypothetical protein CKAH01_08760 [Colletotrichum kahawae]|uniref:Uncharacterized protein n=1 Tax=Colletotrichum kahawae TaxID=34407 RepID=A0AAD9Y209_COLKA|nr:hypothetical protein CKAH01_08760 [Colletotrichum kahawae]
MPCPELAVILSTWHSIHSDSCKPQAKHKKKNKGQAKPFNAEALSLSLFSCCGFTSCLVFCPRRITLCISFSAAENKPTPLHRQAFFAPLPRETLARPLKPIRTPCAPQFSTQRESFRTRRGTCPLLTAAGWVQTGVGQAAKRSNAWADAGTDARRTRGHLAFLTQRPRILSSGRGAHSRATPSWQLDEPKRNAVRRERPGLCWKTYRWSSSSQTSPHTTTSDRVSAHVPGLLARCKVVPVLRGN